MLLKENAPAEHDDHAGTGSLTIVQALKQPGSDVRVVYGYRWLTWNAADDEWIVFERPDAARQARIVIRSSDEHEAVAALTAEE